MPSLEALAVGKIGHDQVYAISRATGVHAFSRTSLLAYNSTTEAMSNVSTSNTGSRCLFCDLPPLVVRSLVIMVSLSITSAIIIALRLRTRYKRLKKLSSDDVLIVLAWLSGVSAGLISHYRDSHGFGDARPSFEELASIFFQQFVFMQFFYLTFAITQISVALHYRRLDGGLSRTHRLCCNLLLAYIIFGSSFEFLSYIFQCIPVSAFWELLDRTDAKCYSQGLNSALLVYGPPLFRITTDIALICVPMPIVFKLSLPRHQKFAIMSIISVTFISIGANLRRLWLTKPDASTPIMEFLTDTLPRIQVWSNIEIHTAIICACAVTLKAPFIECLHAVQRWLDKYNIQGLNGKSLIEDIESKSVQSPSFVRVTANGTIATQQSSIWHAKLLSRLWRTRSGIARSNSEYEVTRDRQSSLSTQTSASDSIDSTSTTQTLSIDAIVEAKHNLVESNPTGDFTFFEFMRKGD